MKKIEQRVKDITGKPSPKLDGIRMIVEKTVILIEKPIQNIKNTDRYKKLIEEIPEKINGMKERCFWVINCSTKHNEKEKREHKETYEKQVSLLNTLVDSMKYQMKKVERFKLKKETHENPFEKEYTKTPPSSKEELLFRWKEREYADLKKKGGILKLSCKANVLHNGNCWALSVDGVVWQIKHAKIDQSKTLAIFLKSLSALLKRYWVDDAAASFSGYDTYANHKNRTYRVVLRDANTRKYLVYDPLMREFACIPQDATTRTLTGLSTIKEAHQAFAQHYYYKVYHEDTVVSTKAFSRDLRTLAFKNLDLKKKGFTWTKRTVASIYDSNFVPRETPREPLSKAL